MYKLLLLSIILLTGVFSCKPRIYSFTTSQNNITSKDSVQFKWKIAGEPTLLFNQKKIAFPPGDSLQILEFTLVAKKGEKEAYKKIQVTLLPEQHIDRVVIPTTDLRGDTLIASVIKDTLAWAGFTIVSVSSVINRPLLILHGGLQAAVNDSLIASDIFKGKPYSGRWEIRTLLTAAEKQDHSIIPERFQVKAVIQSKK